MDSNVAHQTAEIEPVSGRRSRSNFEENKQRAASVAPLNHISMIKRRRNWIGCCLLVGLFTSGILAFAQQQPPIPAAPKQSKSEKPGDSPVADLPKPAVDLPASVDPNSYKIGAEDVIRVVVWKEPELSFMAAVRPDGKVTAPLIGDLTANGITPSSLAATLKEKFGELVNNPLVNVEVVQVRSKKYYITGQVQRTGAFPLVVPTTVLEALTMAGGLAEWANRKKIVIMRGEKRFTFNYDAAVKGKSKKGKSMDDNIFLENGDFVVVN